MNFILGLVGSLTIFNPAFGASFDCAHAAAPREKLICQDAELSRLDDELAQTYRDRQAALSPNGRAFLQHSERDWLRFTASLCPVQARASGENQDTAANCLKEQYRNRLNDLEDVGRRIGPFVFNRIVAYTATPASSEDRDGGTGFHIMKAYYPQIDSPQSAEIDAWNKAAIRKADGTADCAEGESGLNYEIGYASEKLISVEWISSEYCHGAAHGTFFFSTENSVLSPSLRKLSPRDLFETTDGWDKKMQDLFLNMYREKGWEPSDDHSEASIREVVVNPDKWLITPNGIKVDFSAYEVGCYVCAPEPSMLPWSQLKPLMSSHAIAPQ